VTAMATVKYVANRIKSEAKGGGTKNNKPANRSKKRNMVF